MDTVIVEMYALNVRLMSYNETLSLTANSVAKWEALLQDISNIECFSAVSQSLAHKLFPQREKGDNVHLRKRVSVEYIKLYSTSSKNIS